MKVKWIFFDVGSTLVDESNVYERRFRKIAEAAGVSAEDVKVKVLELYKENKKGDLEITKQLSVALPKWETEKEILYPDTVEVLEQLHFQMQVVMVE